MNRFLFFAALMMTGAVAAADLENATATGDAPVPIPFDLNHELQFPLQSVSHLSQHLLIVDADNYTFFLDGSKLSDDGEHIFLNYRTAPRLLLSSWYIYWSIFPNFLFGVVPNHTVLGTFVFEGRVFGQQNNWTNETLVMEVTQNGKPSTVAALFNAPNPQDGPGLSLGYGAFNAFVKANKETWISSNEANVFYSITRGDFNVTTLTKFKVSLNANNIEVGITTNTTYYICAAGNTGNLTSDSESVTSSSSSPFTFTILLANLPCNHSVDFAYALANLGNFTGFTDQRNFYLFGAEDVLSFEHQLPTAISASLELRSKPLKEFFTNGSTPATSGHHAPVGSVLATVTFSLLVALGASGLI
ncbi:hypothetical protein TYRP_017548 [Tyrophagus putrescentiae]|nr:hypothetical protein TYRP_017548 [Tyrophagus putrescentiae]